MTNESDTALTEPICEVVITADDESWLVDFTRSLVADRLAACGHLVRSVRSIYRWDDAIQDEIEVRVALHTRESLLPAIIERTTSEHSYDLPCVLALAVLAGNPDYLARVAESTSRQ